MKRLFDVTIAGLSLIALSPILVCVALLVRCTSAGPVFFAQERIGRRFRPFRIYKFRSMVVDAPARGGQLTAGADPRITSIGQILRYTKVDELPQLWNVLKGDMSLVGPRPEVPKYVELFREDYCTVLSVRPGITDLASLKFRHESTLLAGARDPEAEYIQHILPEKIALAKEYIARSSIGYDLKIILQSLWCVVIG